eukprot:CAMPEP_0197437336 /NCGR_PEP_ID=MMETSP1175-20131217/4604_1 /TAXON_ID=1003142 /ORGANISM="Triceratium dubium, Strain CCMP147" /LENGTH=113 /DNA_ID=CAMNT_0042966833 /DNA_START=215 /DNA_END=556 /DNA_ORIENTATION=+
MAVNSVDEATRQFRECKPVSKALLGSVLGHAAVWLVVSLLLFAINLLTTLLLPPWFLFPVLGWGFGVAVHALVIVVVMSALGLEDDVCILKAPAAALVAIPRSFIAKDGGHVD